MYLIRVIAYKELKETRMETIDVKDLPEPLARAVEAMVNALRQQLAKKNGEKKPPVKLPVWKGKALGDLSRDEIYEDVV